MLKGRCAGQLIERGQEALLKLHHVIDASLELHHWVSELGFYAPVPLFMLGRVQTLLFEEEHHVLPQQGVGVAESLFEVAHRVHEEGFPRWKRDRQCMEYFGDCSVAGVPARVQNHTLEFRRANRTSPHQVSNKRVGAQRRSACGAAALPTAGKPHHMPRKFDVYQSSGGVCIVP